MHTVISQCPICTDKLAVTRLHCRQCDTTIEGQFDLGRLHRLSAEQLQFVELFVRSEGKINRVGEVLGLSYPAVRSRLTEVVTALGYTPDPEPATLSAEERQAILDQVAAGEISAEIAVQLLK